MKKALLVIVGIMLLIPAAYASQEGVLRLDSFTIQSRGIGESGPVTVTGSQNDKNEFTSLKVSAFGREYTIPEKDLKKLPKVFYNGIQLSYEGGHRELGGKTVYIILQSGFTSGVKNQALIAITEDGSIKIE